MPHTYAGKLLRIDLTSGVHHIQPIDDASVRRYLLGSGLAAKIFYEEMDPRLDPLDPANPLLAFSGLLTGTFSTEWANYAAGSLMVCIPVVVLFVLLSKYLVGGLTLGGVKG